jgi:hypothetical protein
LFCTDTEKDYGYFERIRNPYSPKHHMILIGGCHTVGVTAAAKAFSAFAGGRREFPDVVARNAKAITSEVLTGAPFAIFFEAHKVGVSVNTPEVLQSNIMVEPTLPAQAKLR